MEERSIYRPLQAGEIRLLVLLPGKVQDPLSVRLVTTRLQGEGTRAVATYEALSYQWGPPLPAKMITVNDTFVSIRYNLHLALLAIRDKQFPRCLWVDALCINQRNVLERGGQVSIMSKIFRHATKVLVWLGEAADDSDLLFELMAQVEGRLDRLDSLITVWAQAGIDISRFTKQKLQSAFLAISRRPYWTRLWIIQDMLSASSIDLLCGSKSLPWAFFSIALEAIGNIKVSSDSDSCASTPAYAIAATQLYEYRAYPFADLLQLCDRCNSQCEDVRDNVYGLLSIAEDVSIIPDYTKSAAELCLEIFAYFNKGPIIECPIPLGDGVFESLYRASQRRLKNPFWDPVGQFYPALDANVISSWTRLASEKLSYNKSIRRCGRIEKVGPKIQSSEPITDSSIFQHTPVYLNHPHRPLVNKDVIINNVSSLRDCEFHETAAICDFYTTVGNTDEYIRTEGSIGIAKSDGRIRTFWTSNDRHGIASCEIREGDFVCYVDGIEELFVIRREGGNRFGLIGRAKVFYASLRQERYQSFETMADPFCKFTEAPDNLMIGV